MRNIAYPTPCVNYLQIHLPGGSILCMSPEWARRIGAEDAQGASDALEAAGLVNVDLKGRVFSTAIPFLATAQVEGEA